MSDLHYRPTTQNQGGLPGSGSQSPRYPQQLYASLSRGESDASPQGLLTNEVSNEAQLRELLAFLIRERAAVFEQMVQVQAQVGQLSTRRDELTKLIDIVTVLLGAMPEGYKIHLPQ